MNKQDLIATWRCHGFDPGNIRLLGFDVRRLSTWNNEEACKVLIEEELKFRDSLVTPICPCCGHGRTLFVHLQTNPDLVIRPLFSDWCTDCLRELASKMDKGNI